MKKLITVIITVVLTFSIQVAFSQESKIKTVDIKTEISCDHCMLCGSCGQNIFTKIKANTEGVRGVKVDAGKNIIEVKYNSDKTTLEEIEKAIILSGFKANELEPTAEAYNSLDGCCKKK